MKSTFSISIDPKLDEWVTKNYLRLGFQFKTKLIEHVLQSYKDKKTKAKK